MEEASTADKKDITLNLNDAKKKSLFFKNGKTAIKLIIYLLFLQKDNK